MKALEYLESKKRLSKIRKARAADLSTYSHEEIVRTYNQLLEVKAKVRKLYKEREGYYDLRPDRTTAELQLEEAKKRLQELKDNFESRIATLDL